MAKRKLQTREQLLIVLAIAVAVLILAIPRGRALAHNYKQAQTQATQAAHSLNQTRELRALILEERSNQRIIIDRIEARQPNFDLYSYTNATLDKFDLLQIARLQSKGSRFAGGALDVVQLNLTGVSMKQFIDFLHDMHASGNLIALQRLGYLRPSREKKGLDCEIAFMAPKA